MLLSSDIPDPLLEDFSYFIHSPTHFNAVN